MICSNTPGFPRAREWQSRYHKIWTRTGFEGATLDSHVRGNDNQGGIAAHRWQHEFRFWNSDKVRICISRTAASRL